MQFGIIFPTRIDDWQLIKDAEDLGYDRAWAPDSQMIWSDCYTTLALAAHNTSRIHIGSGVSIPVRVSPQSPRTLLPLLIRLLPAGYFSASGRDTRPCASWA